jgi:hypothetical protein
LKAAPVQADVKPKTENPNPSYFRNRLNPFRPDNGFGFYEVDQKTIRYLFAGPEETAYLLRGGI